MQIDSLDRFSNWLEKARGVATKPGPAPGPPPRPGLEWKPDTHRWVKPEVERVGEKKTFPGEPLIEETYSFGETDEEEERSYRVRDALRKEMSEVDKFIRESYSNIDKKVISRAMSSEGLMNAAIMNLPVSESRFWKRTTFVFRDKNGELAGISQGVVDEENDEIELTFLATSPKRIITGVRGTGSEMLYRIFKALKDAKIDSLRLYSAADAKGFYRKMGGVDESGEFKFNRKSMDNFIERYERIQKSDDDEWFKELLEAEDAGFEVGEVLLEKARGVAEKPGPAPGPPPRPGLEWKPETHRWIRPEDEELRDKISETSRYSSEGFRKAIRDLSSEDQIRLGKHICWEGEARQGAYFSNMDREVSIQLAKYIDREFITDRDNPQYSAIEGAAEEMMRNGSDPEARRMAYKTLIEKHPNDKAKKSFEETYGRIFMTGDLAEDIDTAVSGYEASALGAQAMWLSIAVDKIINGEDVEHAELGIYSYRFPEKEYYDTVKKLYEQTQDFYRKKGITHITLHRGLTKHRGEKFRMRDSRTLTSWTTDKKVATFHAKRGNLEDKQYSAYIVTVNMPVENLLYSYETVPQLKTKTFRKIIDKDREFVVIKKKDQKLFKDMDLEILKDRGIADEPGPAPGPPPRPGLEWKPETHRWIRTEKGISTAEHFSGEKPSKEIKEGFKKWRKYLKETKQVDPKDPDLEDRAVDSLDLMEDALDAMKDQGMKTVILWNEDKTEIEGVAQFMRGLAKDQWSDRKNKWVPVSPYIAFESLAVHPRRIIEGKKGAGSKLMYEVFKEAQSLKMPIHLSSTDSSRGFYRRAGGMNPRENTWIFSVTAIEEYIEKYESVEKSENLDRWYDELIEADGKGVEILPQRRLKKSSSKRGGFDAYSSEVYSWIENQLSKEDEFIEGAQPYGVKELGQGIEKSLYDSLKKRINDFLKTVEPGTPQHEVTHRITEIIKKWVEEVQHKIEVDVRQLHHYGIRAGVRDSGVSPAIGLVDELALRYLEADPKRIGSRIVLFGDDLVERFRDIIAESYTPEGRFWLYGLTNKMKEVVPAQRYQLERIVRTETAQVSNAGRILGWAKDPNRYYYNYIWNAVLDLRSKPVSMWRSQQNPLSFDEAAFLWQNQKQSIKNKIYDDSFNQRCALTRIPREDERRGNRWEGDTSFFPTLSLGISL